MGNQNEWLVILDAVQRFTHPRKDPGHDTVFAIGTAASVRDDNEVNSLCLEMITVGFEGENLSEQGLVAPDPMEHVVVPLHHVPWHVQPAKQFPCEFQLGSPTAGRQISGHDRKVPS